MRSFGGFLLILFVSILFHNSVFACIPAVSIKYIVKHRLENFDSDLDISEPVRIAKEDLEDFLSTRGLIFVCFYLLASRDFPNFLFNRFLSGKFKFHIKLYVFKVEI